MFYRLHDLDENIKLDGLEILQAIMHTEHDAHNDEEHDENKEMDNVEQQESMPFEYYIGNNCFVIL